MRLLVVGDETRMAGPLRGGLERVELDLTAIVREVGEQGQKLAAAKGLRFHLDLPPHPVRAHAGRTALRRLLLIVIDNAVKYTHGEVTLSLDIARSQSRVRVTDTGLGLSIAKWIAEGHGGTIVARSEPGEGRTFVSTLPGART